MTYKEQLLNPKWQKKRLEILERDKFTCQICLDTETTLHIYHGYYDPTYQTLAWEYPNHTYKTLCSDCHKALTAHVEEFGNDKEFDVLKLKKDGQRALFIYSNGFLRFNIPEIPDIVLVENTTHKVVQFLINNWLKSG